METPRLDDGHYPFGEERLALREMAFIEAPSDLEAFIRREAERAGLKIIRDQPIELNFQLPDGNTLSFFVWWPTSPPLMHILAPLSFRRGSA